MNRLNNLLASARYEEFVEQLRREDRAKAGSYALRSGGRLTAADVRDIAQHHDNAEALYALAASVWMVHGGELEAIEIFKVAGAAGSREAEIALGISLSWMGAHEEAVKTLRGLHDVYPEDLRIAGSLGRSLHEIGDDAAAVALLRMSYSFDPDLVRPLIEILKDRGESEDLDALLEYGVAERVYGIAIWLGNIRYSQGRVSEAVEAYRSGVAEGDAHSAYNLATVYLELNRVREAKKWSRIARRMGDLRAPRRGVRSGG